MNVDSSFPELLLRRSDQKIYWTLDAYTMSEKSLKLFYYGHSDSKISNCYVIMTIEIVTYIQFFPINFTGSPTENRRPPAKKSPDGWLAFVVVFFLNYISSSVYVCIYRFSIIKSSYYVSDYMQRKFYMVFHLFNFL
jgi:hypothetical protein